MKNKEDTKKKTNVMARMQNYIFTGVLTIIPLMVTWFVVELVFNMLSGFGRPVVDNIARGVQPLSTGMADVLRHPFFRYFLAIILVLFLLVFIGWIATRVIGKKIIELFDRVMVKIPMVNTIYGSMKKLLDSLKQKPDSVQRVVLIPFPDNRKRAVGFVTKTFRDTANDRAMAVVFVPMSPNPTGGFLEILPVTDLISTDWTMDEAMTFIVSGGAVAPENLDYFQNELNPEELEKKAKDLEKNTDYNNLYKEETRKNENES